MLAHTIEVRALKDKGLDVTRRCRCCADAYAHTEGEIF